MDENLSGMSNEEEGYFYLTINDFNELIDKYTLKFILSKSPELSTKIIACLNEDDYLSDEDWDDCYVEGKEWWETAYENITTELP